MGARWGAGKHVQAVPPADLIPFTIITYYGNSPSYIFAVTLPKLAILDLYLHIFVERISRYLTYSVGVVLVLNLIVQLATLLGQCHPITQLWAPVSWGWCNDLHAQYTWGSLPNIVTDFAMLLLPIPMILKLHASWRVKLGISLTFLVGSLYVESPFSILLNHISSKAGYADSHAVAWSLQ